jgi:benzoyl-CoA reductase/2-hydroxyglutaryl-CoA dehydratase subunit BcrC/BadD/HgdB
VPADYYYQPHYVKEMNTMEKLRLEKILGRKISNEAFRTYCTREDYEREQGISQSY